MSEQMPPWPTAASVAKSASPRYDYQLSLRLAWEARARAMEKALSNIDAAGNGPTFLQNSPKFNPQRVALQCINIATDALALVGDLPPEQG